MNAICNRFITVSKSTKGGLIAFLLCGIVTALLMGGTFLTKFYPVPVPPPLVYVPPVTMPAISVPPVIDSSGVKVTATLSQSKIVRGETTPLYLSFNVEVPNDGKEAAARNPVDMIVVLDRSGSMTDSNKLPLAKSAIKDLLSRLTTEDKFALIAFDDDASVYQDLIQVSSASRESIYRIVDSIGPGGSTHMSAGIQRARELLTRSSGSHSKKILLLSDGLANVGVTNPIQLAQMATDITRHEAVLSTIGMGLGFNENVMASLADHGMGSFSYLEHLDTLGEIFAKDLHDARSLFAATSEVEVRLAPGFQLTDASGYPVQTNGTTIKIPTGQLLSSGKKHLTLTFQALGNSTGDFSMANVAFKYSKDGRPFEVRLPEDSLKLAVLEPQHRDQAIASINSGVYRSSWFGNNLGMMERDVHKWIQAGDKARAKEAIANYRKSSADAAAASGIPLKDERTEKKLARLDSSIDESFEGTPGEQAIKQNRLGKIVYNDSRVSGSIGAILDYLELD